MCKEVIIMPNLTISLNNELIKSGRDYAKQHNTSLNALIRELLHKKVEDSSINWLEECFLLMDKLNVNSKGKKWNREDLYDV